jgi:hypothetical protein
MRRLLSNPRTYVLWTGLVVAGLISAYQVDAYLFGFAVFALGAATGVATIAGALFVVAGPGVQPRARWTVVISLLLGVAAVFVAASLLETFHWA